MQKRSSLKRKGYDANGINAGRDIASVLVDKTIEVASLCLYCRIGEEQTAQGLL